MATRVAALHVVTDDGELLGTVEINEYRLAGLTSPDGVSNLHKSLLTADVSDILHIIIARRRAVGEGSG